MVTETLRGMQITEMWSWRCSSSLVGWCYCFEDVPFAADLGRGEE